MMTIVGDDDVRFIERYNRSPFMFEHRLHESELFDIPRLIELSKRLPDAYYSTNKAQVQDGWRGAGGAGRTLPETLADLDETDSLVLLKGVAEDPEFGPMFRDVLQEVVARVGQTLWRDISKARATLVISSPRRVTPYHIDAEANFLFQVRGEKMVNVFDPGDRTLLTDAELEAFYGGDASAARYKPDRQGEAFVFDFRPGKALHIPILAPHWTRNGDSVSVAISINCSLHSNDRLAKLYRVNRVLRRRGLRPSSPGESRWRDGMKLAAAGALERARRLRGKQPASAAGVNHVAT